jgi:RalA-binding protein 1
MVASEFSDSSTDVQISSPRIPVFGLPLAEAVNLCPPSDVNVCLPAVVYRCLEYLLAMSAENEEFVFLLSGSSGEVKTLKERFNTQGDVDLLSDGQYHDVHAVVSLLKLYLRELPTTVLTRKLSSDFSSASELKDQKYMTKVLSELVYRLPLPCFSLLRALSHYLSKVAKNSGRNKMTLHNLVIVLAPTLNIPTPILTVFINEFDAVFDGQAASCSEIATVSGNSRNKADANANSEPGFVPGLLSLRALYDFHKNDGSV